MSTLTPDTEAVLAALVELPIGEVLGRAHLEQLARMASLQDYGVGSVLFEAGDPADSLWFLVSGRVCLSMDAPGRARTELAALSRGEVFGWAALQASVQRSASARVTKAARCIVCPGPPLRGLCERDHDLGFHMMRQAFEVTSRALGDCRMQLLDIYGHPC